MSNQENLGETIRRLRDKKRLEASVLADRAGVSVGTLWRVENGHGGMQWETAMKVLTALGHEVRIVRSPANKLKAASENTPAT